QDDDSLDVWNARGIATPNESGVWRIIVCAAAGTGKGRFTLDIGPPTEAERTQYKLLQDLDRRIRGNLDEQKSLFRDLRANLEARKAKAELPDGRLALRVARSLEMSDRAAAAEAYAELGNLLALSPRPELVAAGRRLQGAARRLALPGATLELRGTMTDG